MGPADTAALVRSRLEGSVVSVEVTSGEEFDHDYPLAAAVSRASRVVERHRPCMIKLEYNGEGPIERTLLVVGKGIVYDTGGADIKTAGRMAGMHRDKGTGHPIPDPGPDPDWPKVARRSSQASS